MSTACHVLTSKATHKRPPLTTAWNVLTGKATEKEKRGLPSICRAVHEEVIKLDQDFGLAYSGEAACDTVCDITSCRWPPETVHTRVVPAAAQGAC